MKTKYLILTAIVTLTLGSHMEVLAAKPRNQQEYDFKNRPAPFSMGRRGQQPHIFGEYRLPNPINTKTGEYYFTLPASVTNRLSATDIEQGLAYAKILSMIVDNQLNPLPIPTVVEAMDGKIFNKLSFMDRGFFSPKDKNADYSLPRLIDVLDPKASAVEKAAWNFFGAPYNTHALKQSNGWFGGGGRCGSNEIFALGSVGYQDYYYVRSVDETYTLQEARDNVLYIINRSKSGLNTDASSGGSRYAGDLTLVSRQIGQLVNMTKNMTLQNVYRGWQQKYDTEIKREVLDYYRRLEDQARKDYTTLSTQKR